MDPNPGELRRLQAQVDLLIKKLRHGLVIKIDRRHGRGLPNELNVIH